MTLALNRSVAGCIVLLWALGPGPAASEAFEDSSVYRELRDRYENSGDPATAYRLARLSFRRGSPDLAVDWLEELHARGWRMGVDTDQFGDLSQHPAAARLVGELQARVTRPGAYSDVVARLRDPELIPESIAYDANRQALFAGSLSKRKIIVSTAGGTGASERDFSPVAGKWYGAVYGIKYDSDSDQLWVLHNDYRSGQYFGGLSVLGPGGELVGQYRVEGSVPAELNDLCLTPEFVFVTDSQNHRVFAGSRPGRILRQHPSDATLRYPNGISCGEGFDDVYVADYGGIVRMDLDPNRKSDRLPAPSGYSMAGIDGLYRWGDSLIGVQNALGTPKVVVARLAAKNRIAAVEFRDAFSPHYRIPTTGFIHDGCLFYLSSTSLDALRADGTLNPDAPSPGAGTINGLRLDDSGEACELLRSGVGL